MTNRLRELLAAADREALWAKFTAGEKLAYGLGFLEGRNEAALSPSEKEGS